MKSNGDATIVEFEIPCLPPSANRYVRHSRGRHFKSSEAAKFERDFLLFAPKVRLFAPAKKIRTRYRVNGTIYYSGRSLDIDNYPKMIHDLLQRAGIIHSDNAVASMYWEKKNGGSNWIKIQVIAE